MLHEQDRFAAVVYNALLLGPPAPYFMPVGRLGTARKRLVTLRKLDTIFVSMEADIRNSRTG